jgi:EpsI family protein
MSIGRLGRWAPTSILAGGVLLLSFVRAQLTPELRLPLASALPEQVDGIAGKSVGLSEAEAGVAGFTDYAFRVYEGSGGADAEAPSPWVSIYLGYYDRQSRGHTIHSPKNCLPGSGWEALSSAPAKLEADDGSFTVNRYVLQNGGERALVLYWYQGRGRVAYNEYAVKWDLLRDAALRRRTDEALARIVVSLDATDEDAAFALATRVALDIKPELDRALPP